MPTATAKSPLRLVLGRSNDFAGARLLDRVVEPVYAADQLDQLTKALMRQVGGFTKVDSITVRDGLPRRVSQVRSHLQVEIEESPGAAANSVMLYRGTELLGSTSVAECRQPAVISRLVAAAQHKPAYKPAGSQRPVSPGKPGTSDSPPADGVGTVSSQSNFFSDIFGMCCSSQRRPTSAPLPRFSDGSGVPAPESNGKSVSAAVANPQPPKSRAKPIHTASGASAKSKPVGVTKPPVR
jgi:hypothetical protein